MNKIKEKLFYFSTYQNIFKRFVTFSILLITIVSLMLFFLFYRSSEKEVRNISNQLLSQTSYVTSIINEQIYNIGNLLINNRKIINAMYNKEIDRIEEYHAVEILKNIQSTYPFIHSIGIYNEHTERYMNTKGYKFADESELLKEKINHDQSYIQVVPRKLKDLTSSKEHQLLTFILSPSYTSYLPRTGGIVINYSEDYVQNMIGNLNSNQTNNILLVDSNANIISSAEDGRFLENIADEDYFKKVIQMDEIRGNFIVKIDQQRTLVSFAKFKDFDWSIVSINPYKDVMYSFKNLPRYTGLIAIIIFIFSIIISLWLTNALHNPINNLIASLNKTPGKKAASIDEFQVLGNELSRITEKLNYLEPSMDIVRKSYLLDYLNGSKVDIESHYKPLLTNSYFTVILLKVDSAKQYQQKKSQLPTLIKVSIHSIVEEILRDEAYETLIIAKDEIGIIALDTAKQGKNQLEILIKSIQTTIYQQLNVSVSIGIGEKVESVKDLQTSYTQAKEAVNQRFTNGIGNVFWYDETMEIVNNIDLNNSNNVDDKILKAINAGNKKGAVQEIKELSQVVRSYNYNQVMFIYNKVLYGLYKKLEKLGSIDQGLDQLLNIIVNLKDYQSLEELTDDLINICIAIIEHLKNKMDRQNKEMIESVKREIDEQYADFNLSLKGIANRVNITPGYLGQMFRDYYNISFNNYLTDVRLSKASELLLLSDEPVSKISKKVGIPNSTYFYTLFRRKYGITPAKYRSMKRFSKN